MHINSLIESPHGILRARSLESLAGNSFDSISLPYCWQKSSQLQKISINFNSTFLIMGAFFLFGDNKLPFFSVFFG